MSGGRSFHFEYCCCWRGRRQAGGRSVLSIAAAAGGETSGGRAISFEYCSWKVGRAGGRLALSIATGRGDIGRAGRRADGRSALSIASTGRGDTVWVGELC